MGTLHDPMPPGATVDADRLIALRRVARGMPPLVFSPAGVPGGTPVAPRGAGLDIRDLRPFEEGDEPRHIDAAATARSGMPQVRTFHDEQDGVALLVADFRRPMLWGTRGRLRSVAAAEALAVAGWRHLASGARVGVLALTDHGAVHERPRPRDAAMTRVAGTLAGAHAEALADITAPPPDDAFLDAALDRVARLARRGARVVLATGLDDPGPAFEASFQALAHRVRLEVLLIRDAMEREAPKRALPFLTRGGTPERGRFAEAPARFDARAAMLRSFGAAVQVIDAEGDDVDGG